MSTATFPQTLKRATGWVTVWGILMILFGALAICLPLASSIGAAVLVAWLMVFGGAAHLVFAFHSHSLSGILWKVLVSVLYIAFGIYLLLHPLIALATLTLVLAAFFLAEGALEIAFYFNIRTFHNSFWVLVDGIVTLLLGLAIWMQWPSNSVWVIGMLLGISLIFSGVSRFMLALAVRRSPLLS
jgi:uncharacterized membrane protein HdeD (DUF308 family)